MNDGVQSKPSPFEGTGLESISLELKQLDVELGVASSSLESIEQQRSAAIAAAEEPFLGPAQEAREKIADLDKATSPSAVAEKIQQSGLDLLSFTALDIILRGHGVSLETFAKDMKELSSRTSSLSHQAIRTCRYLDTFRGFRAFNGALNDTAVSGDAAGIPVGVFNIEWLEETDIQAEHEGRDSRTGIYVKRVDALIGAATSDNIEILNRDIAPSGSLLPVLQTKSIVLNLHQAIKIRGYSQWGEEKAEVIEASEQTITLISAPLDTDRPLDRSGTINWGESASGKSPVVESERPSNQASFNKVRIITWDNNVSLLLSRLALDKNVTRATRVKLEEVGSLVAEF